jgi:hypothetical protein
MTKVIERAWLTDAHGTQFTLKMHDASSVGRSVENDVVLEDMSASQRHLLFVSMVHERLCASSEARMVFLSVRDGLCRGAH